jgi:hypothetical protein
MRQWKNPRNVVLRGFFMAYGNLKPAFGRVSPRGLGGFVIGVPFAASRRLFARSV